MIRILVAAVALTIGLTGYAVAREGVHRHYHHQRDHIRQLLSPDAQAEAPPDEGNVYWSPAGGDPVHYAQTSGFYAGR
jgi:hypothetical protein